MKTGKLLFTRDITIRVGM